MTTDAEPERDEGPDETDPIHWKPVGMVGWYDPRQLVRTGLQIASTSLFTRNADSRLLQPLFDAAPEPHVDLVGRASVNIDYIADTGDGFDATYAVAYWATQASLPLVRRPETSPNSAAFDETEPSVPGDVLILGGDEVYPTGSETEYRNRLQVPYQLASVGLKGERSVFAIPGNHDWYENLVAFHEVFMHRGWFGGWRTGQKRSYFALKLPHGWWLLGTDMQLASDIDQAQDRYFRNLGIGPDDNVVLCHAEPHWVYDGEEAAKSDEAKPSRRVNRLEAWLGDRLRLVIAGDLHHYRRHILHAPSAEGDPPVATRHLVTAGGGGAFLHPTHWWRDVDRNGVGRARIEEQSVRLVHAYPSRSKSLRVSARVLAFPWTNRWFLLASGGVYGLVALTILFNIRVLAAIDPSLCVDAGWTAALSPAVLTWLALMVGGFVASTDTSLPVYRWIGGSVHGLTHAVASVAIPLAAVRLIGTRFADSLPWLLVAWAGSTVVGALVGALLMGGYLFASLTLFGRHRNESFSAIREKGFKNFLRMQLTKDGLTVTSFGIEKTPKWDVVTSGTVARRRIEPTAPISTEDETHPFVIERFVVRPMATPTEGTGGSEA
jgi:hypothetical protein